MKNFLKQIHASEKLINELENGNFRILSDGNAKKIKLSISNESILSPKSNIELFVKTKNFIESESIELDFINLEIDHKNQIFETYDNIVCYLKEIDEKINFSDFYVDEIENKLVIKSSTKKTLEIIENNINNLFNYLSYFSVSDKKLEVKYDPASLSKEKLDRQIEKSKEVVFTKNEVLNETVRKNQTPLDSKIKEAQRNVYFEGFVFNFETKKAKTGTLIYNFSLGNGSKAIQCVIFDKNKEGVNFGNGSPLRMYGLYEYDDFNNVNVLKGFNVNSVQKISYNTLSNIPIDNTEYKRPEFHVHTKMSTLDGIANPQDYIAYAEAYNLESITITDHNSVQSFPDAYAASKKTKVKFNYGVEFDVYDDLNTNIVINEREQNLVDAEYVFFDLETTSVSAFLDEIIEFGAVKFKNNTIIDRKQLFIKPDSKITEFTTSLTSITQEDVDGGLKIDDAIIEIKEWLGDAILVAHNASFDFNFLNKAYLDNGLGRLKNPVIDSMKLSWILHPFSRAHRLGVLAKHEMIEYNPEIAHRADYDAEILAKIFERLLHKLLSQKEIRTLIELNKLTPSLKNFYFSKHLTMISKNNEGLRDINKFVSWANVKYFNSKKKIPSLPLSLFVNKKNNDLFKNVLIGSACSNGVLFQAILDDDQEVIESIINIYDYLEVFPPSSYKHLIVNNTITNSGLRKVIRTIVELGKKHNIPVVATSNAHYAGKNDKAFRDVIISAQRVGGLYHPLHNFRNPTAEKPDAHLRSTTEMFEEFGSFLDAQIVEDIVINNPKKIQSQIKEQKPIKDKLYPPKIEGSEAELVNTINKNIKELYGDQVNEEIKKRIDRELDSIIKHGFSIIYYLSAVAVKKSMDDGYLVGSRGSVGSSIAATLSGITEVNPLKPHYRCPSCKHHEFSDKADSGYDLEDKNCPVCGNKLIGDGHAIPFETFLGFNADKVPDIDLNFSRDNQSSIHLFMKDVLGEDKIFRAGTISTAAPKTAIGYVKNYEELANKNFDKSTIDWLASKIEGGKRTTGQHPGGLIVIPNDMEVYDFTPINYPGDDAAADWKTTHFDFHSIHDNVLKLDFLGHLDPSMIRMLQNLTKVDPQKIPMNDREVISLFESNRALKYEEDFTNESLGIIGLPEFGTFFVRELVREAKPKSFADLVRISGLSHGTDVWTGNAQSLIKDETAVLSEVISVRDDIMTYLIEKGVDNSTSFNIMESVRKGKGLTDEWEKSMRENNVPDWYIDSCKKIKYMFPKAHATAYVMMAYRIAWYKINYPLEYYATFFSKRDVEIDMFRVNKGIEEMKKHLNELKSIPRRERTKKDEDIIDTYNIIFEMYSRGIEFSNIDIHMSGSINYKVDYENKKIIPPFSIVEGVGTTVAKTTTSERTKKQFTSIDDFKKRAGLPKKTYDLYEKMGVFKDEKSSFSSNEQLSLFE